MLATLVPVLLAAAALTSGAGGELVVAVDPDTRVITGYYRSGTGMNADGSTPRFSCIFFFRGEVRGTPPYPIRSWFPADTTDEDVVDGVIDALEDGGVSLHLKSEHGGCWNVQHFAAPEPTVFDFDWKPGTWRGVRIVAADKAHFHEKPEPSTRRKAFVVEGDALRVHETREGWVFAEYAGADGKRVTKGWIRTVDLYADTVPPAGSTAKK